MNSFPDEWITVHFTPMSTEQKHWLWLKDYQDWSQTEIIGVLIQHRLDTRGKPTHSKVSFAVVDELTGEIQPVYYLVNEDKERFSIVSVTKPDLDEVIALHKAFEE
jgi:hypothetical protein